MDMAAAPTAAPRASKPSLAGQGDTSPQTPESITLLWGFVFVAKIYKKMLRWYCDYNFNIALSYENIL
jgi:hypothetical protein